MGDLLPCPFCGAHLVWEAPVAYVHPIGKCILSGRNFKKGPIQQWNRRTLPAAPAEDVRAGALKEAADVDWASGKDVADTAPGYLTDWQRGFVAGQTAIRDAILALIPEAKT